MKRIFIFYIHVLLSKVGHENVLIYSKQASRGKVKLTTVFNSSSSHPQVIPKSSPSHTKIDSTWSSLSQSDPIWSNLIQSDPIYEESPNNN